MRLNKDKNDISNYTDAMQTLSLARKYFSRIDVHVFSFIFMCKTYTVCPTNL